MISDAGAWRMFSIRGDVWPENYSTNSVQKVWAAKFAARHPNVAVIDLSSFKCGNDAPTYGIIDKIISASNTPYLAMHDLDANKASGSIKIRVKTFAHTLKLHKERLEDVANERTTPEDFILRESAGEIPAHNSNVESEELAPSLKISAD